MQKHARRSPKTPYFHSGVPIRYTCIRAQPSTSFLHWKVAEALLLQVATDLDRVDIVEIVRILAEASLGLRKVKRNVSVLCIAPNATEPSQSTIRIEEQVVGNALEQKTADLAVGEALAAPCLTGALWSREGDDLYVRANARLTDSSVAAEVLPKTDNLDELCCWAGWSHGSGNRCRDSGWKWADGSRGSAPSDGRGRGRSASASGASFLGSGQNGCSQSEGKVGLDTLGRCSEQEKYTVLTEKSMVATVD